MYEPPVSFTGLAKSLRAAVHQAPRFTSNVIFWPRHLSRIRAFPAGFQPLCAGFSGVR